MWEYNCSNENELRHYGVKGMKWGIRRATRDLAKADKTNRLGLHNDAVARLSKHKRKINRKIEKLDKKYNKLQDKRDKQIQGADVKASKLSAKAAKLRKKQYSRFTSKDKADKLAFEATKLEIRAEELKAASRLTQAKIDKNRTLKAAYDKGLSDIKKEIVDKGREHTFWLIDNAGNKRPYLKSDDKKPKPSNTSMMLFDYDDL